MFLYMYVYVDVYVDVDVAVHVDDPGLPLMYRPPEACPSFGSGAEVDMLPWGGFWERLVGMMKGLLKKSLGRASLAYEEMQTALCNCEAILHKRPLTTVCSDASLAALTPADFLKEIKRSFAPDIKTQTDPNHQRRRMQYLQTIRKAFRVRFQQEYLGALSTRQKKNTFQPLKVGDIVLI
ncbi:uncharacterized protein [Parasteatoda tepidariorum]|uniref:uncharacterized protein n=1 Tax=Parasteatoda tepidariorum TaxID=114398 RepID=UPI0039BD3501